MTNYELVPYNAETENELNTLLQKTMFQNVHTFVGLYNSGVLNRNFDDTKNVLEQVKRTYKNVSVGRGSIIVQSHEEFMSSELADEFSRWKGLSRLRRELNTEIETGALAQESTLYLDNNGLIHRVEGDKIFTTRLIRVLKEAWETILNTSSINDFTLEEFNNHEDNSPYEHNLENPYENNDTEETEIEEDTTGKELPEKAQSRFFKASDILTLDDSFIRDIYSLMPR